MLYKFPVIAICLLATLAVRARCASSEACVLMPMIRFLRSVFKLCDGIEIYLIVVICTGVVNCIFNVHVRCDSVLYKAVPYVDTWL